MTANLRPSILEKAAARVAIAQQKIEHGKYAHAVVELVAAYELTLGAYRELLRDYNELRHTVDQINLHYQKQLTKRP